MGNRATVCFASREDVKQFVKPDGNGEDLSGFVEEYGSKIVGVYLHWNGGRASIEAFCAACKELGFRGGASDSYGVARFVQVVCNFFKNGGLSCGVELLGRCDCDNYDNGVYVVDDGWNIIGREYRRGDEQMDYDVDELKNELVAMMRKVDAKDA